MQTVLWVISAALVLIDVFNLGATMERALVDTADHIVAQRQGWMRATTDEHGKDTPYVDKWGGRAISLVVVGGAGLVLFGLVLRVVELPPGVVNGAGVLVFLVGGLGFLLFACLMVVVALPYVLGWLAFLLKLLARRRGILASIGTGMGIVGLFI